ncbi:MAG: membrane protein insertase YidC [Thermoguttaceae bacterium]
MDRRLILFLALSFAVVVGYSSLMQRLHPPRKPADQPQAAAEQPSPPKPMDKKPRAEKSAAKDQKAPGKTPAKNAAAALRAAVEPEQPEKWVTLGSVDPDSSKNPYRMLVTLTTKGAALARVELSSDRYRDVDDRSGYLGSLVLTAAGRVGGLVRAVGLGTPAAEAGLKVGDLLKSVGDRAISDAQSLEDALKRTRPGRAIQLSVVRDGKPMMLTAKLRRHPLNVICPEDNDPLSLLLTLSQVDKLKLKTQWVRDEAIWRLAIDLKATDQQIADLDLADVVISAEDKKIRLRQESQSEKPWLPLADQTWKALEKWQVLRGDKGDALFVALPAMTREARLSDDRVHRIVARARDEEQSGFQAGLSAELEGVKLRRGVWKLVAAEADRAVFRRAVPQWGLEITKTYRLAKVPDESRADADFPAYHLEFEIEIRNADNQPHAVAYRLDGPNGLPTEGEWYATRVTRSGGSGIRDYILSFGDGTPGMVGAMTLASDGEVSVMRDTPPDKLLSFVGVDAQYFSAVLMPERRRANDVWFEELMPIRAGKGLARLPEFARGNHSSTTNLTNTSCRLVSVAAELEPRQTMVHRYRLFAGPKKPAILENNEYRLGELVYYGWPIFSVVAVPLTHVLHGLYHVTWNYGLAIILLTVLVRSCMFPLSLKQAAGARKMQLLQPEIKKLQEKYKNNVEARTKAQQELFRKHNYNPLSGCLPIFIQMPIFIGLYRCLMVDIELRDAPLLSHAIRWCSNLAAPDMLVDWSRWMPTWFNAGSGMFGLGPYFNILPLLTIGLMIWQQKMFMPPPADEQAAMQQKMMNFMMIFMGVMFFKVASGLCIYFIVSSLWGLGERRFLPKNPVAAGTGATAGSGVIPSGAGDFGETRAQAKARGVKK